MGGQLLTQCSGCLALSLFVSLVRIDRRSADRGVAQTVIGQPTCVVFKVAVELLHLAVGHQQKLVGGAFEQMPVVRYHQHRTAELLQSHGQRQTHFEIKVVGRLVEQQQIRAAPRDQGQRKAGLFAARKIQHRLIDARTTEVETAEEVAQCLFAFSRRQSLQVQQRAGFGVQRIKLVLGKVAYDQVLAAGQTASQRLQLAREVFDQG